MNSKEYRFLIVRIVVKLGLAAAAARLRRVLWAMATIIALGVLMAGMVLASFDRGYSILFPVSVALSLTTAIVTVLVNYLKAPRHSEAYVTWPAFVTVVLSLCIPLVSSLIWLGFTLGGIQTRLEMMNSN